MTKLAWKGCLMTAAIGAWACGSEVPIGHGDNGLSSGGASTAGAAGEGATAGTGVGGREDAGLPSGGGAGVGGAGATGGVSGSGGEAGIGGGGGSGGGATTCPSQSAFLQNQIPATDVHDVLIVGTDVFFTQGGATDGKLRRAPLATGQAVDFANAQTDPSTPQAFEGPDSLATDGANLYWRSKNGQSVWKKPLSGGPTTSVSTLLNAPFPMSTGLQGGLALGGGKIFWVHGPTPTGTQSNTYKIYSAPIGGGAGTELLSYDSGSTADVPFMPLSLLADSAGIYFSLWSGSMSKTVKAGLDGSNPTDMFTIGQQLANTPNSVLMTMSGSVWRLPKTGGQEFVTIGLEQGTIFSTSQGIAESNGQTYVSLLGTLGDLGCCSCGWVYSVPTAATSANPTVIWAGVGRPTAMSAESGYVVSADIDNDQVLILKP